MGIEINVLNKHHKPPESPNNFYTGRGSPLGNPFPIGPASNREQVIREYEMWITIQLKSDNRRVIDELDRIANHILEGKPANLICFCSPQPCHGDVIKRMLCEAISDEQVRQAAISKRLVCSGMPVWAAARRRTIRCAQ